MATYDSETTEEKAEKSDDPLHEVREHYKSADEYWEQDRRAALDDIRFRAGEQWPIEIVTQRQKDKRPCLTVDKLNQYVRQIVNDGRQNRPSIKVRPVDSKADVPTAEVFQGLIKHIEENSGADAAYDCALDSAATGGFGYFRVLTEYAGNDTFDQEIVIRRIRNPLSVMIDPTSQAADGSDMKYAFIADLIPKEEFEALYPGKIPSDFEVNDEYRAWFGEMVRVCEYWCVEEEDRTLYLMADNTVIPQSRYDEITDGGVEIASLVKEKRNIPKRTVKRGKCSGTEWLEPLEEWPGKYIPLMVVWGNELDIEGKTIHSGIIRPAKDAQRLYNYSRSAFAERVALTPKAPWVAAEGQVEDYADDWATANTDNHSVLKYRPTSLNGSPVPPPQRNSPSDIPAGFAEDMRISEHDIQGAIGMYAASLGAPSNERSGKAIMARQKEGDVGTFHYHDNLNRAIRYCGRVLVDLIPKIYDSTRVVRILGYDGTPDEASINPALPSASQKMGMKMMYNLSVGQYDVTITTGPSYSTLRQEATESMVMMVQANPELMGVIGDLLVKNMDWPGADEISDRLKLTLPPNIQEAEKAKKMDSMPPEMQQAMQQFDMAVQQKDAMIGEASGKIEQLMGEIENLKSGEAVKAAEVRVKEKEAETAAFEAETARMLAESQIANDAANTEIAAFTAQNTPPATEPAEPVEVPEPQMDVASILQAVASMQQPINITVPVTVDGKGASVKQGRAVRQADGSYIMDSIETPVEQGVV